MQKTKDPGLKKSFKGHKDTITAIDFNNDSSQVASCSLDASLLVWKLGAKQVPSKFVGHTGPVYSIAFNPTGTLIATGSADNTVRLWQNDTRGLSSVIKSHSGAVRACSFSFDGQYLLTGSDDKYLKIFTVFNRKHTSTISAHTNWIRSAEFSPDSRLIVSSSDDCTVKLWDSEQLTQISMFEDESTVLSARFHPDGTCLAAGFNDGKLQIWDIRSHLILQKYPEAHNDSINSVAFHNSGRYLVTASDDATMKIFDLRKGSLQYSLYGHEGAIQVVNFSKDGTHFASGGADCNLILWESNLVDPEQEAEANKFKKVKEDSKNIGKRRTGAVTAAEKLKRLQKKRRDANKAPEAEDQDKNKENDSLSSNKSDKYDALAENLAGMMDRIASQLDLITRTVVNLEKRIGDNEEMVNEAYNAYRQHQKRANLRASSNDNNFQASHDGASPDEIEDAKGFSTFNEIEATKEKVKNIMNIINISQYSLAAIHKSAQEVKETTTKLQHDLNDEKNQENLRSPIDEESEDDLERDVPVASS